MNKKFSRPACDDALRVLKKNFGAAFDSRGIADGSYEAIPTGYDELDAIATNGAKGIYLGGIVEFYGPESAGKTAVAMRVTAQAQKIGLHCVWIDAEAGFSPDLAEINGINLKELIMPDLADIKRTNKDSPVPHAGEILNIAYEAISTGAFGLVVIDSIAGLSAPRVLDSNYDPNSCGVGEVPRMIGEQINKIHHACKKNKCTLLLINQLRSKIGDKWNPEDTPGGKAIKFFADQRVRVDRIGGKDGHVLMTNQDPDSGEEVTKVVGHYARLKIIKNKKATPSDPIEVPIYYIKYEPDVAKKLFDLARSMQVISKRGTTYTWKDEDSLILREDSEPEMLAAIRGAKMEPQLAFACVAAEQDEKNKTKSEPVKTPASMKELAGTYIKETIKDVKETIKETEGKEVKKKRKNEL